MTTCLQFCLHFIILISVLELFETALRDPMFYVFYKRIYFFYEAWANRMPEYKKTDLAFDGVKFESVEMDKLLTYFDKVRRKKQKKRP